MTSRKQHPAELRERAVAMVFELRAESGGTRGTLASVGHKLGVNPETLRNWVEKAEVDSGQRPGTTSEDRKLLVCLDAARAWLSLRVSGAPKPKRIEFPKRVVSALGERVVICSNPRYFSTTGGFIPSARPS